MSAPTDADGHRRGCCASSLGVHGDNRGWFKESYQRAKLEELGLPRLEVVQNNVSYNAEVGVTRGIHAEPWDKYISPAFGRVFAAIVDLRAGRRLRPGRDLRARPAATGSTSRAAAATRSARSSRTPSTTTW